MKKLKKKSKLLFILSIFALLILLSLIWIIHQRYTEIVNEVVFISSPIPNLEENSVSMEFKHADARVLIELLGKQGSNTEVILEDDFEGKVSLRQINAPMLKIYEEIAKQTGYKIFQTDQNTLHFRKIDTNDLTTIFPLVFESLFSRYYTF